MDYEEMNNLTNYTTSDTISSSAWARFIVHEVILTLFVILGICCDSLIIYTIFKFQRLGTVSNIFVANWAIADVLSLLVAPSGFRVLSVIESFELPYTFYCVIQEMGITLHFTVTLFVIVVSLDWGIATYYRRGHELVKKYYKFVLGIVWISSLVQMADFIGEQCVFGVNVSYSRLFHIASNLTALLIVVLLHILRAVQKFRAKPVDHSTTTLTLATGYAIAVVLAILTANFVAYCFPYRLALIIPECLSFSSSLINLYLLYFKNQDFSSCLRQTLHFSNNKYQESNLSFDDPLVRTNRKTSISFKVDNQELLGDEV